MVVMVKRLAIGNWQLSTAEVGILAMTQLALAWA